MEKGKSFTIEREIKLTNIILIWMEKEKSFTIDREIELTNIIVTFGVSWNKKINHTNGKKKIIHQWREIESTNIDDHTNRSGWREIKHTNNIVVP